MGFNTRLSIAWVNNSTTSIPVYSTTVHSSIHAGSYTAGGTKIGAILYQEMYITAGNDDYVTCVRVKFRDGSGKVRYGYIDPSPGDTLDPYKWSYYQEPWHYYSSNGSNLINASTTNGYYIHTIKKGSLTVLNPNGTFSATLRTGSQIATDASTVGATYDGYVIAQKYRASSTGTWNALTGSGYGFVDLGLASGAMPSDRAIY